MKRVFITLALAAALGLSAQAASAQTLNTVKQRGVLNCGANTGTCRVSACRMRRAIGPASTSIFAARIAAAIFNDPTKVKFVPLTAKDRFTALQSGEVDVLLAQHHLDLVARHPSSA